MALHEKDPELVPFLLKAPENIRTELYRAPDKAIDTMDAFNETKKIMEQIQLLSKDTSSPEREKAIEHLQLFSNDLFDSKQSIVETQKQIKEKLESFNALDQLATEINTVIDNYQSKVERTPIYSSREKKNRGGTVDQLKNAIAESYISYSEGKADCVEALDIEKNTIKNAIIPQQQEKRYISSMFGFDKKSRLREALAAMAPTRSQ